MKPSRHFILCDNAAHAALCDALATAFINDQYNAKAAGWSGVYVLPPDEGTNDPEQFGILWQQPIAELFEELGLTLVEDAPDESGAYAWVELPPPEPEPSEL